MEPVPAPDVYALFGDDLLGPWESLSPEVQTAWLNLQREVDRLVALRTTAEWYDTHDAITGDAIPPDA